MSTTKPIAVQLYSLRDALSEDFEGIVRKLAEVGYLGVEPWANMPVSAADAARLFKELDLTVPSAHLGIPTGDNQSKILDDAAAYGIKRVIVPYQPREEFTSVDGVKRIADALNAGYEVCKANNLEFGYHNHDFEFTLVDGRLAYDLLLEHIDPNILMQIDTYWVKGGGQDAAELVKRMGTRSPLLHIKDGPAEPGKAMTAVGDGVMDVPAIVTAGDENTEWLIVELDACDTDMFEAVAKSYEYMTGKGLAHGR